MRHQRAIDRPTRDSYVRDNIRHSLHRKLENNEVKGEIVEQQGLLAEGQVGVPTPDCTPPPKAAQSPFPTKSRRHNFSRC
jgi:hypothetical protein